MTDLALCTVVSKNHVPYARVLSESFRAQHPGAAVFLLLVDRLDGCFSPRDEPFELVELSDLGIPNLARFCFQYDIVELNCAAKSYLIRHLLERRGISKLVYLDADIWVLRPLSEIAELLERHSILLTPHLIRDVGDDGRKPGERHILESGIYNAGFLALRNDGSALRAVTWLSQRLYSQCIAEPRLGLFVDQRWLDFIPGMFDGVHVLRHPGANVGHWALAHRRVERRGDEYFVDGEPLLFFHFSGLPLERLDEISLHQDRFALDDVADLRPLFEQYRSRVVAAGYAKARDWPYAFGRFSNGAPIPAAARRMYWELGDCVERFGDPFAVDSPTSFWAWLNQDAHRGSGISRLWQRLYEGRPDVQKAWPDLFGAHRRRFLNWARKHGRAELGIDAAFGPAEVQAAAPERSRADSPAAGGVNVVGHALSEKGMGEALRATVRVLASLGIPHAVVDFTDSLSSNIDRTPLEFAADNPHPVNIVHLNADGIPALLDTWGPKFLRGKYNIGFWVWELADFPRVFSRNFAHLHEVWVPSGFCLDAIGRAAPVPVVKIPYALPSGGLATKSCGRDWFGLPADPFLFLFMFDVHSVVARKNPLGLVEAFQRAFPDDPDVRLVLKLAHGTAEVARQLGAAASDARIIVIDRLLARDEAYSLIDLCDCYVSLHRSEGFGMTLAEAMALGKPVIATGYSGNVDFMSPHNSFLVDYRLIELAKDYGPYPRGSVWADPDLDHASERMRFVYENRDEAARIGRRAAHDVWRDLSVEVVGKRIADRLQRIAERVDGSPPQPSFGRRVASWLARQQLLVAGQLPGGVRRALRTLSRARLGSR